MPMNDGYVMHTYFPSKIQATRTVVSQKTTTTHKMVILQSQSRGSTVIYFLSLLLVQLTNNQLNSTYSTALFWLETSRKGQIEESISIHPLSLWRNSNIPHVVVDDFLLQSFQTRSTR